MMLYQNDAEIIFPARVIPLLRNLRGRQWQQLVDRVAGSQPGSLERQAFTLMMVRLDGCLTCHADSYRAMRGCTLCAQQTIVRYKGSDEDLAAAYERAVNDVSRYYTTGEIPAGERVVEI
ncbi:MAG TPA: hypothetical protein VKY39_02440 [Aggregatilineales bacterium]|nr:hypothetical protein [Aggregatilineales bacterium]